MTFGTRAAVGFAALAPILLISGCSGSSKPPPPVEARPSATMTDHGCTYEGNTSLARGVFTIDVRNGSASDGGFQFSMMAPGATRNDVDAWLKKLNRQLPSSDYPHLPKPPFKREPPARPGVSTDVVGGAISELPGNGLPAGTYALTCLQGTSDGALAAVYVASLLKVAN